jgi:hypothetical protein
MTTPTTPTTQPEPPHVAIATRALAAVLHGDLDVDVRIALNHALLTLTDVHPPYPPMPEPALPLPLEVGVRIATTALSAAIEASQSIGDVTRAALAAKTLRELWATL